MKRRLAVDIDNTLWDLVTPWLDYYNDLYDDNIRYEDIVSYNFFSIIKNATRDEMLNLLTDEKFWDSVVPYPDSFEYLYKLNNEYELYIVTSTSYKTPRIKFDKLFNYFDFLTEDQLVVTNNKHLLNVDILIDDCIECLTRGDYLKLLIDTPYNKKTSDNTIIRVANLKDAYNYLHNLDK